MDSTIIGHPSAAAAPLVRSAAAVHGFVALALALVVFGTGVFHMESFPPFWFDEGWTTCTARMWVEQGHYGCLLKGEAAPPVLAAHFPVVASIAASFQLFGVGIWQARMVGLLYTYGAFLLLYYLAVRLYGRQVALATLVLVIVFPLKWQLHPLYVGRQVLGEMPMLFFLLAGYACFLHVERHGSWLAAAVACWSLAWMTKSQAAPFLAGSFALTLLLVARRGEWRPMRWLALGLVGSWAGYRGLLWVKDLVLAGRTIPHPPTTGLTQTIAVVFGLNYRMGAIQATLIAWPEYMLALALALRGLWSRRSVLEPLTPARMTHALMVLLATGWLLWFALLSAGAWRYALPGLFVAAPCTAAFFAGLTKGFDLRYVRNTIAGAFQTRRLSPDGRRVLAALALLVLMVGVAVNERYALRAREDDQDLMTVTAFLHANTPPSALIETYDSELFLFLERPYTYAPPQALVEAMRHLQNPEVPLTYDPLEANPDYVVVGDYGRLFGFYKPLIDSHRLRLIRTLGRYEVYQPAEALD